MEVLDTLALPSQLGKQRGHPNVGMCHVLGCLGRVWVGQQRAQLQV